MADQTAETDIKPTGMVRSVSAFTVFRFKVHWKCWLWKPGPLPFQIGRAWRVVAEREANTRLLSESDIEALAYGLEQVVGRSFDDLVRATHDEKAYIEANGGLMKFEDFLDEDDPDRDEKAADLAETARNTVF